MHTNRVIYPAARPRIVTLRKCCEYLVYTATELILHRPHATVSRPLAASRIRSAANSSRDIRGCISEYKLRSQSKKGRCRTTTSVSKPCRAAAKDGMSMLGSSNFSADKMIERPARRAPSRNFPKSVNTRVQLISCGEDPDRQFATFAHDLAPFQYPPSKRDGYKAKLSLARVPRPFSSAVCSEVEPTLCGPTCTIARNADSSSNCVCSSISSSTGAGFGVLTLCESRVADHRTRLGVLLAWSHGTAVAVSDCCRSHRCVSDSCNSE